MPAYYEGPAKRFLLLSPPSPNVRKNQFITRSDNLNSAQQLEREYSTGYPRVSHEEGFPLEYSFRADITDEEVRAFDNRLVADILYGRHMVFGHGAKNQPRVSGFVTQEDEEDACTEEDREEVMRRLAECPELASFELGSLSIRTFTVTVSTEQK